MKLTLNFRYNSHGGHFHHSHTYTKKSVGVSIAARPRIEALVGAR